MMDFFLVFAGGALGGLLGFVLVALVEALKR